MAISRARKACFWILGLALGIPAIVIAVIAAIWLLAPPYDRIDTFKTLAFVKEPQSGLSAVLVDYYNGNSSVSTTAVWVVSGAPPTIGSDQPFVGAPVFQTTASPTGITIAWRESRRLVIAIPAPVEMSEDCYYGEYEEPAEVVCANLKSVDVRITR